MSESAVSSGAERTSTARRSSSRIRMAPSGTRADLRRSDDGGVWFLAVGSDEAWVAIPKVGTSGGGGWFRSDLSLDPSTSDWSSVSGADVLALVRGGRDHAAALTAQMVSNCITDGLGLEALALADSLLERGYSLQVSIGARKH